MSIEVLFFHLCLHDCTGLYCLQVAKTSGQTRRSGTMNGIVALNHAECRNITTLCRKTLDNVSKTTVMYGNTKCSFFFACVTRGQAMMINTFTINHEHITAVLNVFITACFLPNYVMMFPHSLHIQFFILRCGSQFAYRNLSCDEVVSEALHRRFVVKVTALNHFFFHFTFA